MAYGHHGSSRALLILLYVKPFRKSVSFTLNVKLLLVFIQWCWCFWNLSNLDTQAECSDQSIPSQPLNKSIWHQIAVLRLKHFPVKEAVLGETGLAFPLIHKQRSETVNVFVERGLNLHLDHQFYQLVGVQGVQLHLTTSFGGRRATRWAWH